MFLHRGKTTQNTNPYGSWWVLFSPGCRSPCSSMADWGPRTDAGRWVWEEGGAVLLLVSLQPQLVFTRCWLTRQPPNFRHGSSYSLGFCLPAGISPACPAGTGCSASPVAFSQIAFRCCLFSLGQPFWVHLPQQGRMMLVWGPCLC